MKPIRRRASVIVAGLTAGVLTLSGCGEITDTGEPVTESPAGHHASGLPKTTVWTGYGVGTSNYSEQAAVAEALISEYDTQVRILGSDTGIGRLTPLRTGQAQTARLSDEAFYAFEGKHEFVSADWGPQDLRTFWTPPTTVAVGVAANSGIETLQDLKGKRVPWMAANPSSQEKIMGILAYAGLTPEDVVKVPVEYGAQPDMFANGGLDMVYFGAQSSAIIEVATQMDFRWIDFDGDEEAEKRLQEYAPSVVIEEFESSIGMEGKAKRGPTYAIQMTTYADFSADEVYAMAKAFHESFPSYRDATATTKDWEFEEIEWMPMVLPHHDGVVRYLEEQGLWTPEMEERNQLLIERGEKLRAGWPEVLANTPSDELAETWEQWKDDNAPHIPLQR
ncbi:TAXI family TRAP transporter solute-binding subunit [Brevibacterium daeguense]|uniref:TAXI family TRAP transporter solute-binding subunit n=1 Tax=Brevibacterium daeguense TaxID=909936 RepID=A0ABP8EK39_9MICO|nr:TAXI family TRAP transporter solute-binding subunit [Brevibacterium daeguense]